MKNNFAANSFEKMSPLIFFGNQVICTDNGAKENLSLYST